MLQTGKNKNRQIKESVKVQGMQIRNDGPENEKRRQPSSMPRSEFPEAFLFNTPSVCLNGMAKSSRKPTAARSAHAAANTSKKVLWTPSIMAGRQVLVCQPCFIEMA